MANDRGADTRPEEEEQAAGEMQLTRRAFLKWLGASSVGLGLAACGVAPKPSATSPRPKDFPSLVPTPVNGVDGQVSNPTDVPRAAAPPTAAVQPTPQGVIIESSAMGNERAQVIREALEDRSIPVLALDERGQTRETTGRNFNVSLKPIGDGRGGERKEVVVTDRDSGGFVVARYDWTSGKENQIKSFVVAPVPEGMTQTLVRTSNDGITPGLEIPPDAHRTVVILSDGRMLFAYREQAEWVHPRIFYALLPATHYTGAPGTYTNDRVTVLLAPKPGEKPKFENFADAVKFYEVPRREVYFDNDVTDQRKQKFIQSLKLLGDLPPWMLELFLRTKLFYVGVDNKPGHEDNAYYSDGALLVGPHTWDGSTGELKEFHPARLAGIIFHEIGGHGAQGIIKCPPPNVDAEFLANALQLIVTDTIMQKGKYGPDVHTYYDKTYRPHSLEELTKRTYSHCGS